MKSVIANDDSTSCVVRGPHVHCYGAGSFTHVGYVDIRTNACSQCIHEYDRMVYASGGGSTV